MVCVISSKNAKLVSNRVLFALSFRLIREFFQFKIKKTALLFVDKTPVIRI